MFTSQGSRPGPKSFGLVGRLRKTFRSLAQTFSGLRAEALRTTDPRVCASQRPTDGDGK